MSDIELVIKIPEEDYLTFSKLSEKEKVNELSYYEKIIANGVPLPKGYRRIVVDANIVKDFKNKIKHYEKDYEFTQEEILNILERYEIKYEICINNHRNR